MLINPTMEKMQKLKWIGMCKVYEEHLNMPEVTKLTFDDRLGLMVDREIIDKENLLKTSQIFLTLSFPVSIPFIANLTPSHLWPIVSFKRIFFNQKTLELFLLRGKSLSFV